MRFKDEKKMWYADTELLAARLANKTELQVQQILDDHDVIKLYSRFMCADRLKRLGATC